MPLSKNRTVRFPANDLEMPNNSRPRMALRRGCYGHGCTAPATLFRCRFPLQSRCRLRCALRIVPAPGLLAYSLHRSEEHTSELQSHSDLVCRLLLEKKKTKQH